MRTIIQSISSQGDDKNLRSVTFESVVASTGSYCATVQSCHEVHTSGPKHEFVIDSAVMGIDSARVSHKHIPPSNHDLRAPTSNSERPSSPNSHERAAHDGRIFSTSMPLSLWHTDPQATTLPLPTPLKAIDLGFGNPAWGNTCDNSMSPFYQGVDTWPPFFDYTLAQESSLSTLNETSALNYFASPKSKDDVVPIYGHSPCVNQESSKDFAFISSILSPISAYAPELMSSSTPSNNYNESNQLDSSGTRRGKTLERILKYKNKTKKRAKVTKKSLPIKKRSSRRRYTVDDDDDDDDNDVEYSSFNSDDEDDDYGKSDDKENRIYPRKALHPKASPCNAGYEKADMTTTYSERSIQFYEPSDEVASLLSQNPTKVNYPVIDRCKCTKSKCLKLYCDCFQAGQICTFSCDCVSCENTQKGSRAGGLRFQAIEMILIRRPDAFEYRPKRTGEGCKCKKNRCLKKYCDCFSTGLKCSSRCKCDGCKNLADGDYLTRKVARSHRRVTRHTERAQDAEEKRYIQNRIETRVMKYSDKGGCSDIAQLHSPIRNDEPIERMIGHRNSIVPTQNLLPALHNDDVLLMVRCDYTNNGTPTNMEEI